MNVNLEMCVECDCPTGRAGRNEDSLYAGHMGPYCEDCWCDVPDKLAEMVESQQQQIKRLTKRANDE